MDNLDNTRKKSIYNILSAVKLTSIFFYAIVIYSHVFGDFNDSIQSNNYLNITTSKLLLSLVILIYCCWSIFSLKLINSKYIKIIGIIENFIFIIFFTSLIMLSKSNVTQYKILFIFIIITATLQAGMTYGMSLAIISSSIILILDLVYKGTNGVNLWFENDLILAAVFILTAWPLGCYVKIEKETSKIKDSQLKNLTDQLTKQNEKHKYIEKMLLKNEDCYNMLIKNSKDAIFVHRKDNLIFWNESAVELCGLEKYEDLKDETILTFTPDEDKEYIKDKIEKIYSKETTSMTIEQRIKRKDGSIVIVEDISQYFIYEGKPTVISIYHDITSEKQVVELEKDVKKNKDLLDESREFNRLITEFLSNISHELKTPLNVIFTALQVLKLYNENEKEDIVLKRANYLKVMKQNCYRLMRLINNLLDMTKIDSGFFKLNLGNYDIVNATEDLCLSIAPYVESKGLQLIFDTEIEEKVMAFDGDKIERIVLNLLSNAIKFTNVNGKIYVNIRDLDDYISISVRDTGIGIPKDKLRTIFERFEQVDKTFRRDREGSGIGLYLVKSFVEIHGGKIDIKSEIGKGSEFTITLPVKLLDNGSYDENPMHETSIESINIEFSDIDSDSKSIS